MLPELQSFKDDSDPRDILNIWHPIDGKWVNITQIIRKTHTEYYNDGELVKTCYCVPDDSLMCKD